MTRQQMGHDIGALTKRAALGSVAGLAGTIVLHGLTKGRQRVAPTLSTPLAKDPGELVVEKAESFLPDSAGPSIPKNVETIAARLLAMGYGMAFGALYGLMQSNEHKDNNHLIAEGSGSGSRYLGGRYIRFWLPGPARNAAGLETRTGSGGSSRRGAYGLRDRDRFGV